MCDGFKMELVITDGERASSWWMGSFSKREENEKEEEEEEDEKFYPQGIL